MKAFLLAPQHSGPWVEKLVDRGDLPLRAPVIPSPGWDRGDPIYNENGPFLLLLDCFSATEIVVWMVLGPLIHLGTLFLEGPQGLVPSTSGTISPALQWARCRSKPGSTKPGATEIKSFPYWQGCGAVTFLVGSGSDSGSGEAFRLQLRLRLRVKLFGGSGSGSGSDYQVLI